VDGDVDAIMTDISDGALFDALEANPAVKRLFPDYAAEDERLYRETGIYTPMHIIGMSKKLDREHPDLAGKLYAAFEKSKQLAYQDIMDDRAGFSVVYLRERLKEQLARWGDPFVYGITPNRNTIDTFARYCVEQGVVRQSYSYEEVFAASTLDT
jgi:4,5-dihydroxyphthalate decarboxylase